VQKTKKIKSDNVFPVVGIGASAGGLEAFTRLIKTIPADSGMAYVLVQHLDPNHDSVLPELLQKVSVIPVKEIADDMRVEPNHIYVIPSNKMMVANDGVLELTPRVKLPKGKLNLPINLFFESLAEVHQAHAIGVVLSGTGSDGTSGLKAIKDHGGITIAQDEATAAYDGMPNSAQMAGVVDFILSPEDIPGKLLEVTDIINGAENEADLEQNDEDVFKQIIALLRIRKGTDFTHYKQTTVRRRIRRRMALNKNKETSTYLKYLRENKEEQDTLYQDLLIPVTSFFRDAKSFDYLSDSIFRQILQHKAQGEPIRIWVAACSTGQEAYSLAICMQEHLGASAEKVQIFATDLSEIAIAKARTGIYTKNELEGVTAERVNEFFEKTNGDFQVNKSIRDMCVFAVHNFLKDPPFGKMDLISCRNVLIYMEPYLQKKALTTFHYALNSNGFLFLGKTETTNNVSELFASAEKYEKVFTKKDVAVRFVPVASQSHRSEKTIGHADFTTKIETTRTDFQKTADDIMLNKYTPAGVVVNELLDIVHFRGATGNYLEQASGKPSHNLLKMAKPGLVFELRNILHKAKKEKTTVTKEKIQLEIHGELRYVTLEVLPLPHTAEPYYLILFHNYPTGLNEKKTSVKSQKDEKDLRILQLEQELAHTYEDMRSITEEQEAVNEELQSHNEELLSTTEELQSLNEELETSKEELQSSNEELTVVNQEIINLNIQVKESGDYAKAIVETIREPLLVLDEGLRIKTANTAYCDTFKIKRYDLEGHLIYEVDQKQWDIPALRKLLENILPEKSAFKNFEIKHTFAGIGERDLLLNACEMKRVNGEEKLILLAIEDITERKQHQTKETELLSKFRNLVMQAPVAICILRGLNYQVELANAFYLEIVDKGEAIINKPLFESLPELKTQGVKELMDEVMTSGIPYHGNEMEFEISRNDKKDKGYFNLVYQPLFEKDKRISGLMIVVNEVTDQVIARKRMEAQAAMVENLLMTAPGFVCTLVGPTHVYFLVNDRYQELFGKRKIKGKPILEALPELKGQGFTELLDKVYETGEPYVGIEIPILLSRDEGLQPEEMFFNFSYQPMYNEHREIDAILVFGYEVTEQVNAKNKNLDFQKKYQLELEEKVHQRTVELSEVNARLLQKNAELQKINKELETFTYAASHDLQEPLRKIQTFADRILEKDHLTLSDSGKDYFSRMQGTAFRMKQLIEDLLAFSRVNTAERLFENTDLNEILEQVKKELTPIIVEKHALIQASELCHAHIIPLQFHQLLYNLLANSLKFTRENVSPIIKITSRIVDGKALQNETPPIQEGLIIDTGHYCHICIQDNGIGFDQAFSQRIFEVFQKLHRKEEYPGTGIGLAIVNRVVENHGGVITVLGEIDKGATFNVYLPAVTE